MLKMRLWRPFCRYTCKRLQIQDLRVIQEKFALKGRRGAISGTSARKSEGHFRNNSFLALKGRRGATAPSPSNYPFPLCRAGLAKVGPEGPQLALRPGSPNEHAGPVSQRGGTLKSTEPGKAMWTALVRP